MCGNPDKSFPTRSFGFEDQIISLKSSSHHFLISLSLSVFQFLSFCLPFSLCLYISHYLCLCLPLSKFSWYFKDVLVRCLFVYIPTPCLPSCAFRRLTLTASQAPLFCGRHWQETARWEEFPQVPFFSLFKSLISMLVDFHVGEGKPLQYSFLGESHGQRSLVGYSPWGRYKLDTTERLHFYFSLSCIGEGNGNPLQCSCLENPRDSGAWWAAVCVVAQSRTQLKRLSSSSSSSFPCKGTYDHLFIYPWTKALCLWVKFIDCGFIVTDGQDPGSLIWGLPQIFVSVFLWVDQFL